MFQMLREEFNKENRIQNADKKKTRIVHGTLDLATWRPFIDHDNKSLDGEPKMKSYQRKFKSKGERGTGDKVHIMLQELYCRPEEKREMCWCLQLRELKGFPLLFL